MDSEMKPDLQLQRVMKIAALEAEADQSPAIGVQHVLSAMVMEGRNPGAALVTAAGLTLEQVRALDFVRK